VGERAGYDLAGAAVKGHVEKFRSVGSGEDKGFAGDERPGVFKRGVAVFETFGDHSVAFTRGDPVDLAAEFNALGNAVDRDDAFCAIMQGCSNGRGSAKNVDDHYYGMIYIIQM